MHPFLSPSLRRTSVHFLTFALALTAIAACAEGPVSPLADSANLSAEDGLFARAPQVNVCHRTGGGEFVLLTINGNAAPAHQAHGDGAPGGAVTGSSGATFSADCVPQTQSVTGTYVLQSVGGNPLPALGTGELMHSATIVLEEGGNCSLSGTSQPAQEDPNGEIIAFDFQPCSYALEGTDLTLSLVDGEEAFELTLQWLNGQLILQILIQDDGDETDEGVFGDGVFVRV